MERNHRLDNFKGLLIFLVLFGHLLELFAGSGRKFLYVLIYTFHMPAFAFSTGYFAKNDLPRAARDLLLPYGVFQTLYLLFSKYILQKPVIFQYATPDWLLWYLPAAFLWIVLLPIFKTDRPVKQALALTAAAAIALLAGYAPKIGYFLTLSRALVFLPFFLLGYYRLPDRLLENRLNRCLAAALCAALALLDGALILSNLNKIQVRWLYGSLSFAVTGSVGIRAAWLFFAAAWTLGLYLAMPRRPVPVLARWGQYTMGIYLFHGPILRLLWHWKVFAWPEAMSICVALAMAVALCLALGNRSVCRLARLEPVRQRLPISRGSD